MDYKYSKALLAKQSEELTWTVENLGKFFEMTTGFIPGAKMSFAGLRQ